MSTDPSKSNPHHPTLDRSRAHLAQRCAVRPELRDQIGLREVPLRDSRHLPALPLQPQHSTSLACLEAEKNGIQTFPEEKSSSGWRSPRCNSWPAPQCFGRPRPVRGGNLNFPEEKSSSGWRSPRCNSWPASMFLVGHVLYAEETFLPTADDGQTPRSNCATLVNATTTRRRTRSMRTSSNPEP